MLLTNWHKPGEPDEVSIDGVFRGLLLRLRIPEIQDAIYRQCLTANERCEFDTQREAGLRAEFIDQWLTMHRSISHRMAITQLAWQMDFLTAQKRDWLLRELGEDQPVHWEIQNAVSTDGLVLVQTPPTLYWEGSKIPVEWTGLPVVWKALFQLVVHGVLTEADIYTREAASNAALANVVARLKQRLPPTLTAWIKPGLEKRTHRLRLDRSRIRVFRDRPNRKADPSR